jgi:hypothetical protein
LRGIRLAAKNGCHFVGDLNLFLIRPPLHLVGPQLCQDVFQRKVDPSVILIRAFRERALRGHEPELAESHADAALAQL